MQQKVLSLYRAMEKMRLRRWGPDVAAVKIGSGVAASRHPWSLSLPSQIELA
jgi:hypothetical protein